MVPSPRGIRFEFCRNPLLSATGCEIWLRRRLGEPGSSLSRGRQPRRESERRSTTETHRSAMNKMITKKNATSMILGGGKKKAAAKKTTPRKTGTVRQVRPRTRRRRWERRKKNREQVSDATLSPFLSRPKGGVGYKKFEGRPLYLPDIEPPGERDTREASVPKHDVYRRSRI